MATPVPPQLVLQQWPTALAMAGGGAWSLLPHALRDRVQGTDRTHTMRRSPGTDRNLDAFAAWAGAPVGRYDGLVPPISVARWAMPMVARLSAMAPYNLLKVVNQGVTLRTPEPLPRGPLTLTGRLAEVREIDGRVRVETRVEIAPVDGPTAWTLDTVAAVVTGRRSGGTPTRRDEPAAWRTLGSWRATTADGKAFFALTGDFNPIHTSRTFASRTRFGGPILHGFGSLARTHELVVDALGPLVEVDIRFVAPVPLPSPTLEVQLAVDDRHVRLVAPDGTVHLAGTVIPAAEAHRDHAATDVTLDQPGDDLAADPTDDEVDA